MVRVQAKGFINYHRWKLIVIAIVAFIRTYHEIIT